MLKRNKDSFTYTACPARIDRVWGVAVDSVREVSSILYSSSIMLSILYSNPSGVSEGKRSNQTYKTSH